jgi:hypothetical protein
MRNDKKAINIGLPEEQPQKTSIPFQEELKFNTEREFPRFTLRQ